MDLIGFIAWLQENLKKIMEKENNLKLTHTVHFNTGVRTKNAVKIWKNFVNAEEF